MSTTASGLPSRSNRGSLRPAIELISSMRFAISLLVVLAIASVIGTVLTQDDPYANYVNQFGPFWADIFRGLSLYTVYSAWWFMLILIFLVISVSLCVTRNGPKMIADIKSWKDRVREDGLRAFRHKGTFDIATLSRADATVLLMRLAGKMGYRLIKRETDTGATLIAGKRGALTKLGYVLAHVSIVVICLGGLIDSNLPIKLQMWLLHRTPTEIDMAIADIAPEHRLSSSNPTFRGFAMVSEGKRVSTAVLSEQDGALVQDLPFSVQLDKFVVAYYSTGMPKLFASDIVLTDSKTGERIPARVEVNKPFTHDGISIYQSGFQDGGSRLAMTAWPMAGGDVKTQPFEGTVGATGKPVPRTIEGGEETVELTDFRAINVEDITDGSGATDARGVGRAHTLQQDFDARLGSGAKRARLDDLRNLGPSVQYKVRRSDGQAREYRNYMLPVAMSGQPMFLAGVRLGLNDPFRFLRIPADERNSVKEWMNLRAALETPDMRVQAARRFVRRSEPNANGDVEKHLVDNALAVINLFAGAQQNEIAMDAAGPSGGFQRISSLIDRSKTRAEQEEGARLLLHTLKGVTLELWQLSRTKNGEPEAKSDEKSALFIQSSINALSDSFLYGAPFFLQLDSFKQVQSSTFQLTRAPGERLVYVGSLLLVLGIFSMFYVRERRLWFWLKDTTSGGTSVLMAMSTARRTLDFEKEFAQTRDAIGAALGVKSQLTAPPASPETPSDVKSTGSHDSTR
jgi:cytochrome c biogenesis protein